ncbi:MAG: sulfur-carrier protein adenylyltransferase/sulfurtransferase [Actinomycetota bacterium]|jgi:molybdopterin/thiamine biosynthesis adenylyltransferase/rhodanese-related sulfurtransferase|nr:sulfur-carrier protein adenylyltransferase/sulfurtransferase [Actinomycetota bacterium]
MANFRDLLGQVRSAIREVTPEEIHERYERGDRPRLLDVREQDEVEAGMIPGADHLSRAHFESRVEDVLPNKDDEIVIYCASGVRSAFAVKTLTELGYSNVASMSGGYNRWAGLGFESDVPHVLDAEQRDRYSRHILLPEVGTKGQLKLLNAKVLSIGAGGLGSPALLYMAAAGVGTLGIVDSDVVETSNLQRQIIHSGDTVGMLKAESAQETIKRLNPDVQVNVHAFRLDESNARDLISQYDIVVDGCDNFDTRYIVNDTAVALRKPVIHGSIFRFEGMTSTFIPFEGPCYRCLYPAAPPPELAPT